jgi:isopentenyl diphosphate isomerase/L-lactate dehydrogenase-like FMN-dependent dehydrogenase/biotin carboxylase
MAKTIMIIGGGVMQIPAIMTAKEMGLTVIVTDYNPKAYGLSLADIPVIMSTKDIEGSVRVAKEYNREIKIDGVITVGTDASMTVAAVANALNLPGIKFEVAEKATSKIKMREAFLNFGVPSPRFLAAWSIGDTFWAAREIGFPLVIKPSDNMGARGVVLVKEKSEIEWAFHLAKECSPSGEIIVEEYMEGPELSIDALVYNGKIDFCGIADRIIDFPPYFVELGHILPSNMPKDIQKAACKVMEEGIRALGIDMGAAKGDIKITKEGPKIIELAARLSGGFMSGYTLPLATGYNVIKAAIEIALGYKPTKFKNTLHRTSVEKAIIPHPGRVISIEGVEEAKKLKGVAEIIVNTQIGDTLHEVTSNIGKAANVITVAKSREEALKIAEKAIKLIKIEVGAPPILDWNEIKLSAQSRLRRICRVCDPCEGINCSSQVPGMGAVGKGESFQANIKALKKYKLNVSIIHNIQEPEVKIDIFGIQLNTPVLAAPITGTKTNMGGAIEAREYTKAVVDGCRMSGSIAMVGDGATPSHYKEELQVIKEASGWGIPIFKPRVDQDEVLKRIKEAENVKAVAVGMDIDAAVFLTMSNKGQLVGPKSLGQLRELIKSTTLPFILKGIMTVKDAENAYKAGAEAIVVSNHGGRVLDCMPGSLDVLPEIVEAVGSKILIMVDGGIRGGIDVLKCLALGAKAVLVGRPIAICAVGKQALGVEYLINRYTKELKEAMILTGCPSLNGISREIVYGPE